MQMELMIMEHPTPYIFICSRNRNPDPSTQNPCKIKPKYYDNKSIDNSIDNNNLKHEQGEYQ